MVAWTGSFFICFIPIYNRKFIYYIYIYHYISHYNYIPIHSHHIILDPTATLPVQQWSHLAKGEKVGPTGVNRCWQWSHVKLLVDHVLKRCCHFVGHCETVNEHAEAAAAEKPIFKTHWICLNVPYAPIINYMSLVCAAYTFTHISLHKIHKQVQATHQITLRFDQHMDT